MPELWDGDEGVGAARSLLELPIAEWLAAMAACPHDRRFREADGGTGRFYCLICEAARTDD